MKTFPLFLVIIVLVCSCNSAKKQAAEAGILNVHLAPEAISVNEVFDRIEVIPIETLDSSFIKNIDRVIESNNKYYILDDRLDILFWFDKNGKYISKIDKTGDGPGEYNLIYDVSIDTLNNKIRMLSPMGSIYTYDMQGNFIEKARFPWGGQQCMIDISDNYLAVWSLSSHNEGKFISIFDKDSTKLYDSFWKGNDANLLSSDNSFDVFYQYGKDVYFYTSYASDVYKLTEQGVKFAYKWNFYNDSLNLAPYLEIVKEDPDRFFPLVKSQDIPYRFCCQFQNDHYYYTQLYTYSIKRRRNVFYSKIEDETIVFDKTKEGIVLSQPFIFNDDYIICTATYEDLEAYKKVLSTEEFNKIAGRKEDDNPFLVKFYFKP